MPKEEAATPRKNVSAADHHGQLDAQPDNRTDLFGDKGEHVGTNAEA